MIAQPLSEYKFFSQLALKFLSVLILHNMLYSLISFISSFLRSWNGFLGISRMFPDVCRPLSRCPWLLDCINPLESSVNNSWISALGALWLSIVCVKTESSVFPFSPLSSACSYKTLAWSIAAIPCWLRAPLLIKLLAQLLKFSLSFWHKYNESRIFSDSPSLLLLIAFIPSL